MHATKAHTKQMSKIGVLKLKVNRNSHLVSSMTSSSHTGEHTLHTLNLWSTQCQLVKDCSSNLSGWKMGGNVGERHTGEVLCEGMLQGQEGKCRGWEVL